jgi:general secretion pathway protein G
MQTSSKKAFTVIELIFVIVVIGILAAIAVPKFAATRDDALITRGMATLASVRSAIATERQKRILRGDFTDIDDLGDEIYAFNRFDDANGSLVLEYPIKAGTSNGKWSRSGTGIVYTFYHIEGKCDFNLTKNRLTGECLVFGD